MPRGVRMIRKPYSRMRGNTAGDPAHLDNAALLSYTDTQVKLGFKS